MSYSESDEFFKLISSHAVKQTNISRSEQNSLRHDHEMQEAMQVHNLQNIT